MDLRTIGLAKVFSIYWLFLSLCIPTPSVSASTDKNESVASVKSHTTEYRFFTMTTMLRDDHGNRNFGIHAQATLFSAPGQDNQSHQTT
jgi:hypothetical protein